jgi:hypothetical protein
MPGLAMSPMNFSQVNMSVLHSLIRVARPKVVERVLRPLIQGDPRK